MKSLHYRLAFALLLVGYYQWGEAVGYTASSTLAERLCAIVSHYNLLHLCINLLSFNTLFKSVSKVVAPQWVMGAALLSALFTTYVAQLPHPTMGASGVVYYLVGVDLLLRWGECYFRISPRRMERYTLLLLFSLVVTLPMPQINTWLHLTNFMLGVASAWLYLSPRLWGRSNYSHYICGNN